MIQDNIVVEVERRHETGKNAANRLRAADQIPAVIYGEAVLERRGEPWTLLELVLSTTAEPGLR